LLIEVRYFKQIDRTPIPKLIRIHLTMRSIHAHCLTFRYYASCAS
jgi:hypothetical protein